MIPSKGLLSLLAGCCILAAQAQTSHPEVNSKGSQEEWRETIHRVHLNASLLMHGDPGYALGVSYTRFLSRYLGVTGGLSLLSWYSTDYNPRWEVTDRQGKVYHLDEDDDTFSNLSLYVGPSFRLPIRTFGRDQDYTLSWECTPTVAITFPNQRFSYIHPVTVEGHPGYYETKHARNRGGQWHYWQLKNALSLQCDNIVLSLGYSFSNQKPFSAFSRVLFDGKTVSRTVKSYQTTHEFCLSIGYGF